MKILVPAFALALALSTPRAGAAPAQAGPAAATPQAAAHARVRFDYHSGFLLNLHHYLYNLAVHPKQEAVALAAATAGEADAIRGALAFYRAHYADSDMMFGEDMAAIKRALSLGDDARRDPHGLMLPHGLADALALAAPAYARLAWAHDDAANRAWIARVSALDARYGAQVQARVERALEAGFPARPVRVDLVSETGTRQGGYTDTQIVIPSGRPEYQNLASLEMLYHEAAHVQTSARLEEAIAARAHERGRDADSELWHVLHFYTVGAAVSEALARENIAYVQYAEQRGLYARPWAGYMASVEGDWKPYLAGRESWAAAIEHMVERLPAAK
ncbi:hypothetical protein [Massilia sp. 9096]|uniref:hypothetical protein n=1 Tax=Massilia sp. 9096 TaxID=1500894 RepID=UPI00055B5C09|nr:hypothetical protein [Massilia sp. 9096]